jgi:hypothetical protein
MEGCGVFFSRERDLVLKTGGMGETMGPHGAEEAARGLGRAERGTEFHQGGIEIADALARENLGGGLPEEFAGEPVARVGFDFSQAAENAGDVAVEDGFALSKGD